jgi:hypothetical protein
MYDTNVETKRNKRLADLLAFSEWKLPAVVLNLCRVKIKGNHLILILSGTVFSVAYSICDIIASSMRNETRSTVLIGGTV